jgi:hypothetical protein
LPGGWSGGQVVISNAAGLLEAGHSLVYLQVHIPIGGQGGEVVLAGDFVGDKGKRELHVFEAGHGCTIVEIFYIEDHEFCTRGGDGAIQKAFGGGEAGTLCGGDAGEDLVYGT